MVPYPIPSSTSKYDSSEDWQLKARFFGYWIKERGGKNGMHGCKRKKQGKKGKSRADQAYSRSNEINDCLFVPEPEESPSLFVRVSKHRHYTPMKEEGGEGKIRSSVPPFPHSLRPFARKITFQLRILPFDSSCKRGAQMLELRVSRIRRNYRLERSYNSV